MTGSSSGLATSYTFTSERETTSLQWTRLLSPHCVHYTLATSERGITSLQWTRLLLPSPVCPLLKSFHLYAHTICIYMYITSTCHVHCNLSTVDKTFTPFPSVSTTQTVPPVCTHNTYIHVRIYMYLHTSTSLVGEFESRQMWAGSTQGGWVQVISASIPGYLFSFPPLPSTLPHCHTMCVCVCLHVYVRHM